MACLANNITHKTVEVYLFDTSHLRHPVIFVSNPFQPRIKSRDTAGTGARVKQALSLGSLSHGTSTSQIVRKTRVRRMLSMGFRWDLQEGKI